MYYDGTPVRSDGRQIQISKSYSFSEGGVTGGFNNQPESKMPINGVATFEVPIPLGTSAVEVTVCLLFYMK